MKRFNCEVIASNKEVVKIVDGEIVAGGSVRWVGHIFGYNVAKQVEDRARLALIRTLTAKLEALTPKLKLQNGKFSEVVRDLQCVLNAETLAVNLREANLQGGHWRAIEKAKEEVRSPFRAVVELAEKNKKLNRVQKDFVQFLISGGKYGDLSIEDIMTEAGLDKLESEVNAERINAFVNSARKGELLEKIEAQRENIRKAKALIAEAGEDLVNWGSHKIHARAKKLGLGTLDYPVFRILNAKQETLEKKGVVPAPRAKKSEKEIPEATETLTTKQATSAFRKTGDTAYLASLSLDDLLDLACENTKAAHVRLFGDNTWRGSPTGFCKYVAEKIIESEDCEAFDRLDRTAQEAFPRKDDEDNGVRSELAFATIGLINNFPRMFSSETLPAFFQDCKGRIPEDFVPSQHLLDCLRHRGDRCDFHDAITRHFLPGMKKIEQLEVLRKAQCNDLEGSLSIYKALPWDFVKDCLNDHELKYFHDVIATEQDQEFKEKALKASIEHDCDCTTAYAFADQVGLVWKVNFTLFESHRHGYGSLVLSRLFLTDAERASARDLVFGTESLAQFQDQFRDALSFGLNEQIERSDFPVVKLTEGDAKKLSLESIRKVLGQGKLLPAKTWVDVDDELLAVYNRLTRTQLLDVLGVPDLSNYPAKRCPYLHHAFTVEEINEALRGDNDRDYYEFLCRNDLLKAEYFSFLKTEEDLKEWVGRLQSHESKDTYLTLCALLGFTSRLDKSC